MKEIFILLLKLCLKVLSYPILKGSFTQHGKVKQMCILVICEQYILMFLLQWIHYKNVHPCTEKGKEMIGRSEKPQIPRLASDEPVFSLNHDWYRDDSPNRLTNSTLNPIARRHRSLSIAYLSMTVQQPVIYPFILPARQVCLRGVF